MMLDRHLAPIARRLRNLVTRAVVSLVEDTEQVQRVQVQALKDEVLDRLEHWLPYGLTTHAPGGCEALLLSLGGAREQSIVVAVADRRYRLTGLETGEVALYDDQGQVIKLQRSGIEITAPQGLTIKGNVTITGTTTVQQQLTAQNGLAITGGQGGIAATMTGHIALQGSMTASGGLSAASMAASGGVSAGSVTSTGAVSGKTLAMDGQTLTAGTPGQGNVSVPTP